MDTTTPAFDYSTLTTSSPGIEYNDPCSLDEVRYVCRCGSTGAWHGTQEAARTEGEAHAATCGAPGLPEPDDAPVTSDVAAPGRGGVLTPERRVRSLTLDTDRRETALQALTAACAPYGSLPLEVPALMLEWAGADYAPDTAHQIDTAHRLLAAIRGVDCDQCSALTIGDFRAAVRTPTSGAEIEIRRYAGGWAIAVDFGPRGSHHRADQICDGGLPWTVIAVASDAAVTP